MAKKVKVLLIDDMDGTDADETLTFSLDGESYEIDLNSENAARLRDALTPYREKARRHTTHRPVNGRGAKRRDRQRSADIRAWAAKGGIKVADRGRIPADVVDRYEASQGDTEALDRTVRRDNKKASEPVALAPVAPEEPDTSTGGAVATAVAKGPARKRAPKKAPAKAPEATFQKA